MKPIQTTVFNQTVSINSVKLDRYNNGALAVSLMMTYSDDEDGFESPTRLSVNFADNQALKSEDLPEGQFIAKDYSEMEDIFAAVLEAGIVKIVGPRVVSGYISCPICELTELGKSMIVGPMPAEICDNCCQPMEDENLFVCNKCGHEHEKLDTPM